MTPPALSPAVSGRSALEVARELAQEAGALALAQFRQPQEVTFKGRGNPVSETDYRIERLVSEALHREFPGHRVLSEESAAETGSGGWVWVCDPLDGTRNFVSGIPFFCINLALCHDGEPVLAMTYDPSHGETFWAERGGGAWVNDRPARVSEAPDVPSSVLGVDLGYDDRLGKDVLRLVHHLFPAVQNVRIPGSAALGLAYAACGRYDLFLHENLYPWDLAAGILLVREAGGAISERDGRPITLRSPSVIAGGRQAQADFLRWQRDARTTPDPQASA